METQYQLFIDILQKYQPLIIALMVVQARMFGFMNLFPLFTWARIQGQTRTMLGLAISFPLAFALEDEIRKVMETGGAGILIIIFTKEMMIGTALGLLLGIPFWGVQSAGDIIDAERGSTQQNQTDPVNAQEVTTTGTIMLLSGLSIFVIAGGLFAVIKLIYESYQFWPAGKLMPNFEIDALLGLGSTITLIYKIGMIVAGPTLIILFMVDLVIAFENKLAPGIQLGDLSQPIKNAIVGFVIPIYGIFLAQYIQGDWQKMVAFLRVYLDIAK